MTLNQGRDGDHPFQLRCRIGERKFRVQQETSGTCIDWPWTGLMPLGIASTEGFGAGLGKRTISNQVFVPECPG